MLYALMEGICRGKKRNTGTANAGSAFDGWKQCFSRSVVWEPYGRELNRNEAVAAGLGADPVPDTAGWMGGGRDRFCPLPHPRKRPLGLYEPGGGRGDRAAVGPGGTI